MVLLHVEAGRERGEMRVVTLEGRNMKKPHMKRPYNSCLGKAGVDQSVVYMMPSRAPKRLNICFFLSTACTAWLVLKPGPR